MPWENSDLKSALKGEFLICFHLTWSKLVQIQAFRFFLCQFPYLKIFAFPKNVAITNANGRSSGWKVFCLFSQVLDGAGLDVDFHLLSPKGETLVFDERKSDGVHTVETEDGDYMFCFDNTFSTISEKVIFFELILDNMGEDGQDQEDWKKYVTGTDLLDMKLEDILESINSVKARLSKSVQIQTLLRAFEARDRNIQESNFDRVNFWSMVNLGVMVVVSAVQVYMLKSLFEDKRKSRT
ncbi:transmembrane emp24 domain-containing protein 5 [Egretta garzetta]|uniref:transmembrane emp24 domain-containing protein 5 n=1 Tax=Egretta garzetta TaxID=188379 RepID=UPI00163BB93E|nr:transmembrane emp24 domain-containing protein 5 [Egretta garzetta]